MVGLVVRESLAVADFLAVQQDLPQREAVDVEVRALVFQPGEQPQPVVVDVRVRQRPARGGAEEFVQLRTQHLAQRRVAGAADVQPVALLPRTGRLVAFEDLARDSGPAQPVGEAQSAQTGTDDDHRHSCPFVASEEGTHR
jgi:hypothetical protein